MISDSSPNSGWLSTSSLLLSISVGRLFGSPPNSSYHNPSSRMRYYGISQKKKMIITACDIIYRCTHRCHCIEWSLPLAYCSWRLFWVYASSGLPYWECSICAKTEQMVWKKKNWNMNRELHSCSSVYNYNNRGDSNIVSIGTVICTTCSWTGLAQTLTNTQIKPTMKPYPYFFNVKKILVLILQQNKSMEQN